MNHPRKLPQRAECPDTWGSDRDRPEAPEIDHTQKRTGDKTSLKRRDHPCTLLEKFALLVLKHAGELATAHSCVTVFTDRCSPVRPRPPLLCRNARTRKASRSVRKSSSETPPLGSEAKGWLMRCTGCLLYSRCDQRQLDAMIACQCPLARLVTLEVDRSLWRDPNSSVIRRDSEWPTEREHIFSRTPLHLIPLRLRQMKKHERKQKRREAFVWGSWLKSKDRWLHPPAAGLTVLSALRQGEDYCPLDKILKEAKGDVDFSSRDTNMHTCCN